MNKKKELQEKRKKYFLASKNIYRYLFVTNKEINIYFDDSLSDELYGEIIGGSRNSLLIRAENSEILVFLFSVKYITFRKEPKIEAVEIYDISKNSYSNNIDYIDSGSFFKECIDKKTLVTIYFADSTKMITQINSVGKYDLVVEVKEQIIILQTAKITYIERTVQQ